MTQTVDTVDKCSGCPVRELFPKTVFVPPLLIEGSTRLAVAECPGSTEVEQGFPLVGASGSWLRGREDEHGKRGGGLYKAAGVDQSTVSLCNVINCGIAAQNKNVYPTDAEARGYISKADAEQAQEHCLKNHVNPILADPRWTRLDILGDKSLHALTGQTGILRFRGSPLVVPATGKTQPSAIATLHPAFLARSQELMPAVVRDLSKSLDVPEEHFNTHPSLEDVKAFTATAFAADIETVRATGEITMVGLSADKMHAICVPFSGVYKTELQRIFGAATTVVGHNILQFDQPHLEAAGIEFPKDCFIFDTMLAQHILQPDLPHGLDFLGSFFTNVPAWKHLSSEDEELYCCRDVAVTWLCYLQLRPMLRAEKLDKLFELVQVPLARICHLLTETGFRIDPARLKTVRAELENSSQKLELELPAELKTREVPIRKRVPAPPGTLSEKTGKPLKYVMTDSTEEVTPWKSSDQLQNWLYEICKLPVQTHAKTNEKTSDKTAIPKLIRAASQPAYAKEHGLERTQEVIRALRALTKIRQIASLLSTFVKDSWEDAGIERIHASFSVHGTASGRLSSSGPNLQNLPTSARYIYVPSYKDWVIVSSDFASLENRLTALLSNDYERLDRLAQPGYSEHKYNASVLFDIPYSEVVKDSAGDSPYTKAKKVTHGLNYGEGPLKIARINDLPFQEVKTLVDKWKAANPKTIAWQAETAARAKADGYLVTPFQRKRWFYCLDPQTRTLTPDLKWRPIGDLAVGDSVIGFDEELGFPSPRFRESIVTATGVAKSPRMRIHTNMGDVISTPNHGWVVRLIVGVGGVKRYIHRWLPTEYLRPGDQIVYFNAPWRVEDGYSAGRVSGLLDGEGHICTQGRGSVVFSQKLGRVLDDFRRMTSQFNVTTTEPRLTGNLSTVEGRIRNCMQTRLTVDSPRSALEILGRFQPLRLVNNARQLWEGCPAWGNTTRREVAVVESVETVADGSVIELSTSTETLIAEGFLSHNTSSTHTESLSFLPQSSAADILIRCMIALCYQRVGWPESEVQKVVQVYHPLPHPARLLVTVHDSFVLECPLSQVEEIKEILEKVLTQPWPQFAGYQFPIETGVGPSWGEAK